MMVMALMVVWTFKEGRRVAYDFGEKRIGENSVQEINSGMYTENYFRTEHWRYLGPYMTADKSRNSFVASRS